MNRLAELIGKLNEQFEQNAGSAVLLKTTQQIEAELRAQQIQASNISTSRVSVMMPAGNFLPADTTVPGQNHEETAIQSSKTIVKNLNQEQEIAPIEKMPEPVPVTQNPAWLFDPIHEVPTMASQEVSRDLNDLIGIKEASLNDKLKTDTKEIAHSLTDAPVRDLKKAIGINDRFVFVNELFRGDEVMYERSIKTINSFKIFPEAEYWIERELKVKLGWDEESPIVHDFYRIVKRRFL